MDVGSAGAQRGPDPGSKQEHSGRTQWQNTAAAAARRLDNPTTRGSSSGPQGIDRTGGSRVFMQLSTAMSFVAQSMPGHNMLQWMDTSNACCLPSWKRKECTSLWLRSYLGCVGRKSREANKLPAISKHGTRFGRGAATEPTTLRAEVGGPALRLSPQPRIPAPAPVACSLPDTLVHLAFRLLLLCCSSRLDLGADTAWSNHL
jgi:hypothetical protein